MVGFQPLHRLYQQVAEAAGYMVVAERFRVQQTKVVLAAAAPVTSTHPKGSSAQPYGHKCRPA
jgi:hypothetical protein